MRKLIVANIVSLDGYFEGPGGNVMALPMDGFFDEHNLERQRAADTLLFGAKTDMGMKGYWPAVAEDPSVSPAVAADPAVADLHQEIGRRDNELRKVVVSDTLSNEDTAPWTDTTTIVLRCSAAARPRSPARCPGCGCSTRGAGRARTTCCCDTR
jgi:hypothetical protein